MVLTNEIGDVVAKVNLRTEGRPIAAVQNGLARLKPLASSEQIAGVATTGSARELIGLMVGANLIKNEITTHAVAALYCRPDTQTIMEIGGQDSKIIIIRDGLVVDFAMNTVCAAGTGSFLDQQASRLNIDIESFGTLALQAQNPVTVAGRCAVFAESDMIHKQQMGHALPDIAAGLCEALVRNYLSNVGKGKEIMPAVLFQGGVAANQGMRWAFQKVIQHEIFIPEHFDVMGAWGGALLVKEKYLKSGEPSAFLGWQLCDETIETHGQPCGSCANQCEVVALKKGNDIYAYLGDRCGKWSGTVE